MNTSKDSNDSRREWQEPQIRELHVEETAMQPGVGPDGEVIWADCTRS